MAHRNDFSNYGSTVQEYHDDPQYREYRDSPTGVSGSQKFNDICDKIGTNISKINSGANAVERAMKVIGTDRDKEETRDKIHEVSLNTNKVVQETTRHVKTVASMRGLNKEQKFRIDRLKNDFQDSVQRFISLQKKAAELVKKSVKLTTKKPKAPVDQGWNDGFDDDKTRFVEEERRREEIQVQDQLIEDDLALIRDREERIRQLEADILDVNEIFKDLSALVNEQGEAIDSIEANVDKAYSNVEQGTKNLSKASEYQKKSRKKMCILIVILVIIIAVVTIIIVTQVHK